MLEFHNEYINLPEEPHFAFRYNRIGMNGLSSGPFTHSTEWPSQICSISESAPSRNIVSSNSFGIFAVRIEDLCGVNNAVLAEIIVKTQPEKFKTTYDKVESEILLLEYFLSDIVYLSKDEIVLRQCNVVHRFNTKEVNDELKDISKKIERHIAFREKLPLKSFAREINDRGNVIKLLSKFLFKDSEYAFTMLYYSAIRSNANIDVDVILFFPLFMAKIEMLRNKYGQIIDDSFIFDYVQSFQNLIDLQNYQIMTIVDAIYSCLHNLESDIEDVNICQDAYYIANCKMSNRPVEKSKLTMTWHPKIIDMCLDAIKDEFKLR